MRINIATRQCIVNVRQQPSGFVRLPEAVPLATMGFMVTFASSKPKWYQFQRPSSEEWGRLFAGICGSVVFFVLPWLLKAHWLDVTLPVLLFVVAPLVLLWVVVRIIRFAWTGR